MLHLLSALVSGDRKDSVNGTDSVIESKEILEDSTAEGYGTEGKRKMSTLSRLKQKITKDGSDSTKSAKKKRPKVVNLPVSNVKVNNS